MRVRKRVDVKGGILGRISSGFNFGDIMEVGFEVVMEGRKGEFEVCFRGKMEGIRWFIGGGG